VDPCNVGYIMGLAQLPLDRVKWEVMQKAAKANPNVKIVARGEGKYLPDPSIRAAQDMIQANKDLDVIVAVGDQMAIGVEQAIKDAKLEGKIKIVGDGGSEIGVEAVRAGRWFGTTLNIPMTEGKLVAELAIRAGRGEKVSEGVNTLDHRGEIPPILTQSNKNEWTGYKAQWKG
jgi:ribose transport system substrate-binding protein